MYFSYFFTPYVFFFYTVCTFFPPCSALTPDVPTNTVYVFLCIFLHLAFGLIFLPVHLLDAKTKTQICKKKNADLVLAQ